MEHQCDSHIIDNSSANCQYNICKILHKMPATSGRWTNGYANIPVDFKFHSCTLKWLELKLHFLNPLISIPRKHASTELSHSIASWAYTEGLDKSYSCHPDVA